jgi:hypothetical protein
MPNHESKEAIEVRLVNRRASQGKDVTPKRLKEEDDRLSSIRRLSTLSENASAAPQL